MLWKKGFSSEYFFFAVVNLLVGSIPPAISIFIEGAQLSSIVALKKKNILCVQPDKIIYAGKIKTMCFDKTGTLTKKKIDILGYSLP